MSVAHNFTTALSAAKHLPLTDRMDLVQRILGDEDFADFDTGPLDHALEALIEELNEPDPDAALSASVDRAYDARRAA